MLSRTSLLLSISASALALAGLLSSGASCSSSGSGGSGGGSGGGGGGPAGGPVSGPADAHCGTKTQPTSAAACHPGTGTSSGTGTGTGTGGGTSTGAGGAGGMEMSEYGDTLNNAEGDDDDCKYHVKWTATDIRENKDVTFTVVLTEKGSGKPSGGAEPYAEVYLNDLHPAPNSNPTTKESPAGTYAIGPVRFDAAGKWTVRFHFFGDCEDASEESPHGHAAFFVNVP